jgi:F0F1-type ATP synthase delta subunit
VRHLLEVQFTDAEIIEVNLKGDEVTATVRSPFWLTRREVEAAEEALEDDFGHDVQLEITNWRSIRP